MDHDVGGHGSAAKLGQFRRLSVLWPSDRSSTQPTALQEAGRILGLVFACPRLYSVALWFPFVLYFGPVLGAERIHRPIKEMRRQVGMFGLRVWPTCNARFQRTSPSCLSAGWASTPTRTCSSCHDAVRDACPWRYGTTDYLDRLAPCTPLRMITGAVGDDFARQDVAACRQMLVRTPRWRPGAER